MWTLGGGFTAESVLTRKSKVSSSANHHFLSSSQTFFNNNKNTFLLLIFFFLFISSFQELSDLFGVHESYFSSHDALPRAAGVHRPGILKL
jgi:hypothetical protein